MKTAKLCSRVNSEIYVLRFLKNKITKVKLSSSSEKLKIYQKINFKKKGNIKRNVETNQKIENSRIDQFF